MSFRLGFLIDGGRSTFHLQPRCLRLLEIRQGLGNLRIPATRRGNCDTGFRERVWCGTKIFDDSKWNDNIGFPAAEAAPRIKPTAKTVGRVGIDQAPKGRKNSSKRFLQAEVLRKP